MPCKCIKVPIGEGGYGDIMVIETRWMVVEICLFVSKEPLINPENGGSGAGIIDLSWLLPIFSMLYERRVRRQFIRLQTTISVFFLMISWHLVTGYHYPSSISMGFPASSVLDLLCLFSIKLIPPQHFLILLKKFI